jgi:hypothetical protein
LEKTKKITIASIALALNVSYGLFFYLQTITENDVKKHPYSTAKTASDRTYKAISQNIVPGLI